MMASTKDQWCSAGSCLDIPVQEMLSGYIVFVVQKESDPMEDLLKQLKQG